MNRISLRVLLVLLTAAGIALLGTFFVPEAAQQTLAAQPSLSTEPTQILEPEPAQTETTIPPQTEPREERFLLTFAGDCTFGSDPASYYAKYGFVKMIGEDYAYPLANVLEYFENDDFSIVNLEGPLSDVGSPASKKHTFRGPARFVNILTENSVEAVTLANNHTLDYGRSAYEATCAALDAARVSYVEENSSAVVTTESGLTIGLYAAVYYSLDMEDMVAQITAMKEQGTDLIIFLPHWGTELRYTPDPIQQEAGRAAIDAGAHIVCGSHPHVLQPIETYNGGIIYYSLGNFSFGGNGNPGDYDTALLQQEIIRDSGGNIHLGELTVIPCCVSSVEKYNNFQPTPYPSGSEEYARVMEKLGLGQ